MIKKFKTILFIVILFCTVVNTFVYAGGIKPKYESIEIKLKNYKNTQIIIKDKDGNERTFDENFVQIANNNIIIENECYTNEESLENITIEITNNLGVKDTLNFDFKSTMISNDKIYLYHYNCDNGKIHDFSIFKECKMLINKNKLVFIAASIALLISCIFIYKIIFIIFGIIKKFLHYVLYIKRK